MQVIGKQYEGKDLVVDATFECDDIEHTFIIVPQESKKGPSGQDEKVEGTGLIIKFLDGQYHTGSRAQLKAIMSSRAYKDGKIRARATDPTGFWRQTGVVKTVMKPVFIMEDMSVPDYDTIAPELKKLKEAKPEEPVEPVVVM